jgi:tetratricopeptide (TPR) repeat protein
MEIARTWNLSDTTVGCTASLGYTHALMGRCDEGLSMLEQALNVFESTGHRFACSLFLVPLGQSYLLADRPADAREFAARALTLAREDGRRSGEASALRLLGDVTARLGLPEHAERHYLDALAIAEERGMRPLVAHCHLGLGRLHWRTGQREEDAGRHLASATAMFQDMGMSRWLASAAADTSNGLRPPRVP